MWTLIPRLDDEPRPLPVSERLLGTLCRGCDRESSSSEGAKWRRMQASRIEVGELRVDFAPAGVPYAVLIPEGGGAYPLSLFLHGGGGSHQNLIDTRLLFERWWSDGVVPPMVVATASTGPMSYYLDHPDGSARWESFIAEDFLAHLRSKFGVRGERESTFIAGISMGGYGALKIAFSRPERFAAVAAIQPILEPGLSDSDIGARNRLYHMVGGPRELLGENRDAVFQANNPANRARAKCRCDQEVRTRDLSRGRRRGFSECARRRRVPSSDSVGPRSRARVPAYPRRRSWRAYLDSADARRVRVARLGQCANPTRGG